MNAYQFVSEVYRLLGELSADSLRSLDGMSLAPDVQPIVNAFMAAKRRSPQADKVSQPLLPVEADPTTPAISPSLSRPSVERADIGLSTSLESLLSRSQAGLTNSQFVALLRRAGLEVPHRPKESRADLIRKVNRAVQESPLDRRERIVRNLEKYAQTGETEGWMKVIRSGKN